MSMNRPGQNSVAPNGETFPLPGEDQDAPEMARLEKLAAAARNDGREVVVVMGVGFVGAVMAAIVADTVDRKGQPSKFVIAMSAPQRAELLEDTVPAPRRVAGQGGGSRGGAADCPHCEGEKVVDRDLQQRLP